MLSKYLVLFVNLIFTVLLFLTGAKLANAQQGVASAKNCLLVGDSMSEVNVLAHAYRYIDIDGSLTLNIKSGQMSARDIKLLKDSFKTLNFTPTNTKHLVIPRGEQDNWLRFCLRNSSNRDQSYVLSINPAITNEVDFYPLKVGESIFTTGSSSEFSSRDINAPSFNFNIALSANQSQEFYLRIRAGTRSFITATLADKESYHVAKDKREGLDGVFVGVFLGLVVYTLLLYLSIPQWSSFFYMVWCLSALTMFIGIDGRVLQYVFPNSPPNAYLLTSMMYPLSTMLGALFARNFLNLKNHPRLDKIGLVFLALFTFSLVLGYQFTEDLYFILLLFALTVTLYYGLVCPIYLYVSQKSEFGKYFLIAEIPFVLTSLDRAAFAIGAFEQYYIPYPPKVGLVASMVLIAYYLGLLVHRGKNKAEALANEQEIKAENLAELNKAKSDFFANVSHELRTPLTLIQGPLSQLLEKPYNESTRQSLKGVLKQSKSLQGLVDQLLMLSKYEERALELEASKVTISEQVRLLATQFESQANAKGIDIEVITPAPNLQAYVDLEKLQIIINNLLSNAIKFTPEKGLIRVGVYTQSQDTPNADTGSAENAEQSTDEYLEIRVEDNGPGIPDEELERVFDRFYQSKTSTLAGSGVGTGIGLALVKDLVELHAGRIEAQPANSVPQVNDEQAEHHNRGSVFSVYLPLGNAHLKLNEILVEPLDTKLEAQAERQPLVTSTSEVQPNHKATDKNKLKLLIVDDNQDMRVYLKSLLESNYHIIEAADGIEAQAQVKQESPDLIITDLMMPKRNGIEFVESLKNNRSFDKIPVIMLTARAGIEDRLDGLIAAVDDYMTKPFDARELKIRVENLLKKHAQFKAFYDLDAASIDSLNTKKGVDTKAGDESESISKIRSVIEDNISDTSFGVNELADKLHISRATLRRRLLEETKFTPSEFLRHCRLEKARQLSNLGQVSSIKELAAAVGFSQASYFSRVYQKTFNTEPVVKRR